MEPSRHGRLRHHVVERVETKPPTLWRALGAIFIATGVFVVVSALAMRLVEPETFTNMGDALWFSVVTVSTVGYGDLLPETGLGRFVAGVIMMFALAFVPAVTSIVVSVMMARRRAFGESSAAVVEEQPEAADPERQNDDRR
jgi:voltage-gated potassium channel Kch